MCVMRNLSYQLYSELPPSVRLRLEGPRRATAAKDSDAIGCFTLYSKKDTEVRFIFSTIATIIGQTWTFVFKSFFCIKSKSL